jgi:hypothetical protein
VKGWIARGERAVWPAVGALKVRCAVESELDRGYQVVRRQKGARSGGRMRRGSDAYMLGMRMRRESDGGGVRGDDVTIICVGDAGNANANANSRLRRGSRVISVSVVDPAGTGTRDRDGGLGNGNESVGAQRDRANSTATSNFAAAHAK